LVARREATVPDIGAVEGKGTIPLLLVMESTDERGADVVRLDAVKSVGILDVGVDLVENSVLRLGPLQCAVFVPELEEEKGGRVGSRVDSGVGEEEVVDLEPFVVGERAGVLLGRRVA
jgi:hypothetical protein